MPQGYLGWLEAVAISARRIVLVLATAALVGAPLAFAQDALKTVVLTADAAGADAQPGGTATFGITANNTALVQRNVRFEASGLPPGWSYNLTPDRASIPGGKENRTTLVVFVPEDQADGTVPLQIIAKDGFGDDASNVLFLNVSVRAPPPLQGPPQAPRLSLSIASASAAAGTRAESVLTLLNGDAARLRVTLGLAPDAWAAGFQDGITEYAVDPGVPLQVRVHADVPENAPAGEVARYVVTATTKGYAYQTLWNVTALAGAGGTDAASPTGAETPEDDGAAADAGTPAPEAPFTPVQNLALDASVDELHVSPGGTATATLRLRNTGNVPLDVSLKYQPPEASWAMRLDASSVTLVPDESVDVSVRIDAPTGIFPGGTGLAQVQAIAGDLVRVETLTLRIVPDTTPKDETTAAAIDVPAPASGGDQGLTATMWAAVGVATVGGAALAVASRPLREKLVWAGVGLYTRLAQPDILGHAERDRLYKIIEQQPGIHFHALQRDLGWNTGTLTYHLRVLERHQFVVSRRDGPYRRFFKVGTAPRKETFSADAPQGLRADVLEAIRSRHGISQSDLAMALGANKQTVNYHVKALERQGVIRVERRGRETFLYLHEAHTGPAGPARA